MRIAGLSNGRGRSLLAIADRSPGDAHLSVVLTADPEAPVVGPARERGVEVVAGVDPGSVLGCLGDREVDLACLDGWDRPLPEGYAADGPPTLTATRSLVPAFDGESDPVGAALREGVELTGCTVRYLGDDGEGDVLTQQPVPVYAGDDPESLTGRIDEAATAAYPRAVERIVEGERAPGEAAGPRGGTFPDWWLATADRRRDLRYGENPHQDGAVYADPTDGAAVVGAEERNPGGKELSYNNYNDADAALALVAEFDRPAATVVKHANPAGCGTADSVASAYDRALSTDPMSAFGGVVALNRDCDRETAAAITDSFKEVVVAPGYDEDALAVLREEDDLRVLDVGAIPAPDERPATTVEKPVSGGRLLQDRDDQRLDPGDLEVVTERDPTDEQVETMRFAWQVVKHVRSNAIALATGTETVGIGAGQMSRVDAVRIAARKADEDAEGKSADGAVMASDAFFPFPDGVEAAAEAGVEAVVQPGGSVNDDDVIAAADELGLAMAFTGRRAFRHG